MLGTSPRSRPGQMTPLAERMGHLQALRLGLCLVVLATSAMVPSLLGAGTREIVLPTAGYLFVSGLAEGLRRTILKRGLGVVGLSLLIDGLYLGWIVFLTGGSESPLRFLLYVHLVAVTLLASYRTGLKIALWHSLVFYLGYYGRAAGILGTVTHQGRLADADQSAVFEIVAFWLVAIGTAVFSAVNERELRRRKSDFEALAAMGTDLEHVSSPKEVASTLLERVCSAFEFQRGLVLGARDESVIVLAAQATEDASAGETFAVGEVIAEALSDRRVLLVRKLDPNADRSLNSMLPTARNLLVAPLLAEGNVVGVLVVERGGRAGFRIERRIVTMVEQFAAHAALALRNARLLEQIQIVAATDPLTGVANRRTFANVLDREIARSRRTGESLALVMVDIDHFKSFNDTQGHQAGDETLRNVALAIAEASREFDTVARYGGEEFAVVLPLCSPPEAAQVAERLRQAASSVRAAIPVTASAGVAVYPFDGTDPDILVRAADEALYAAKRAGRNRLVIAGEEMPSSRAAGIGVDPALQVETLSSSTTALVSSATAADVVRVGAKSLGRLLQRVPRARAAVLGGAEGNLQVMAPGPARRLEGEELPDLLGSRIVSPVSSQMAVPGSELASLFPGISEADQMTVSVAPLLVRDEWRGALVTTSEQPLPHATLGALSLLAVQLSTALENCELREAVRATQQRFSFLEEQLRHKALHDPLTNLANRVLFSEQVDLGLRRRLRSGKPLAVLTLDLDDFKTVNNSLGPARGDQLLVEVAQRLGSSLRSADSLARLDGDEFAVLVEEDGREDALRVADRILDAFEAPFLLQGREIAISASVGVAFSDSPDEAAENLIRNAVVAMHIAKAGGRAGCEIFEPSMHTALLERLELKVDLQRAVDCDEFIIHYQPILNLLDGRLEGMEALIRWNHPTRGTLSPAHFISLAEETGLIVPLGRWVIREACRQAREWQTRYADAEEMKVSVNLSAKQLQHLDLVAEVEEAIVRSGLNPASLILEITESVLMSDVDVARQRIRDLKRLGVQVAIDDFGTGYSSLSYLRRFDLDVLKIDRYFIEGVHFASEEAALVRAIIDLGKSLHMQVVAEGVEVVEQLTELQALGCDLAQGYLFSRPQEPIEVEQWLAQRAQTGALPGAAWDGSSVCSAQMGDQGYGPTRMGSQPRHLLSRRDVSGDRRP
jgi:diguanylate cyclase (GGDEF)-like protein